MLSGIKKDGSLVSVKLGFVTQIHLGTEFRKKKLALQRLCWHLGLLLRDGIHTVSTD